MDKELKEEYVKRMIMELSTEKLLAYRKKAKEASAKVPNGKSDGKGGFKRQASQKDVHKAIKHDVYRERADELIKKKTGKYKPNILDRVKARLKGK